MLRLSHTQEVRARVLCLCDDRGSSSAAITAATGRVVVGKPVRRSQIIGFFAGLPRNLITPYTGKLHVVERFKLSADHKNIEDLITG